MQTDISGPTQQVTSPNDIVARSGIRGVARNFVAVMIGQLASSGLGFLTLSLNSRTLSPSDLGILFLVQATCELAFAVCSLQPWSMVIKFGSEAIASRDGDLLRKVWRFALLLDVSAALVASATVVLVFRFVPGLVAIDASMGTWSLIYAASLAFSPSSAAVGALRLCDAFGAVVKLDVFATFLLFVNAVTLHFINAPLVTYLVAVPVVSVAEPLLKNLIAGRRISRVASGFSSSASHRPSSPRYGTMLRFALGAGGSSTLSALQNKGEILIIGGLLGPAAVALYGVAYRFAALFARFAEAGRQSVYPEIGYLLAIGRFDLAAKLGLRLTKFATVASLPALMGLFVLGSPMLSLTFGAAYSGSLPNMLLIAIGMAISLCTFALDPLIQAGWGAERFFLLNLVAFVAFVAAAVVGPLAFGMAGCGAGRIGFASTMALLSLRLVIRRRNSEEQREQVQCL